MLSFKKVKSLKTIILFSKMLFCNYTYYYILHIIQKYISKNVYILFEIHGSINQKSEMEGLHYFQKKIQL